jgi:FdhE protein
VDAHAYLRPVAQLCARVESLAADVVAAHGSPALPAWDDYEDDFREGIPLLQSSAAAIDLEPAGRMTGSLVGRMASDSVDGKLASEAAALAAELRARPDAPRLIAAWLLGEETFDPPSPGLLRYPRLDRDVPVSPLVDAFSRWRDEERWHRKYCPTCGSAPAMGLLIGVDPRRQRFLSVAAAARDGATAGLSARSAKTTPSGSRSWRSRAKRASTSTTARRARDI